MALKVPSKKKLFVELKKLSQSKIVQNFFVCSFGALLLRGINILFAPITMRILSPADYGIIALSSSFVGILGVLLGLGQRGFLSMEYFHLNTPQRKSMLNNIILMYLVFGAPVILFLCLYPDLVNKLVFLNKASNLVIIFGVLYSFLFSFTQLFYNVLGYRQQVKKLTGIQITAAVFTIGPTLLFLCFFKWGVVSVLLGQLLGIIFVCIIGLKSYFATSCHLHLDTKKFRQSYAHYLKTGFAFLPGNICGWALASSDRWILAQYTNLHDVGIYSLAAVFGQLFQMMILTPMIRAYIPAALNKFSKNKDNLGPSVKWNRKNMVLSMVGLVVLVSVGYAISKPILRFILPLRYQPAINYIWLILMGQIFLLGEHFTTVQILFHKKIRFHAVSLFIPSLLNIGLNIVLIPHFGITGCVVATLIAYLCYFATKLSYNFYLDTQNR